MFISLFIGAQGLNFDFLLKPIEVNGLGGIQSYAIGIHQGKWVILGGRLDGLHRRQPFAAFDIAGHNNQIIIFDPIEKKVWKRAVSELPANLREPLSSTNMQFYQNSNILYLIGGYGYSGTLGDHTTYATLTAVDLEKLYTGIINNTDIKGAFRQISHPELQVTGGYLGKIEDTYHLVGGQKFIGRYNPMGPDHGPGFIQEYTDAIKRFKITDNGTGLQITEFSKTKDEQLLHKRDYNMAHQIMPDGREGLTAFSGVFRQDADLPFLNSVNISLNSHSEQADFVQLYNHYHCAHLTLYSELENEMHTVFFGGIAQYYEENGLLIKDDNVPFVNTIATVYRDREGIMKEKKLEAKMPGFLGAGSEFIPIDAYSQFDNGVIKYDQLSKDTVMVGYIYGGIRSTMKNIFFVNNGTQSIASPVIYEVHLIKAKTSSTFDNKSFLNVGDLEIFPNPAKSHISIRFTLKKSANIQLSVHDESGKELIVKTLNNLEKGTHSFNLEIDSIIASKALLTISDGVNKISKAFFKND